jgi:hypothetical protein
LWGTSHYFQPPLLYLLSFSVMMPWWSKCMIKWWSTYFWGLHCCYMYHQSVSSTLQLCRTNLLWLPSSGIGLFSTCFSMCVVCLLHNCTIGPFSTLIVIDIIMCFHCHGLIECELEKYLVTVFLLIILNGSLSPFGMKLCDF